LAQRQKRRFFKHPDGQWCKKVFGKPHYFGTDLETAPERWADEKDHHLAGRVPPTRVNGAAAGQGGLCTMTAKKTKAAEVIFQTGDDLSGLLWSMIDEFGLARNAIAQQASLSQSTLSRIFTGKRPAAMETLVAVANTLGRRVRAVAHFGQYGVARLS